MPAPLEATLGHPPICPEVSDHSPTRWGALRDTWSTLRDWRKPSTASVLGDVPPRPMCPPWGLQATPMRGHQAGSGEQGPAISPVPGPRASELNQGQAGRGEAADRGRNARSIPLLPRGRAGPGRHGYQTASHCLQPILSVELGSCLIAEERAGVPKSESVSQTQTPDTSWKWRSGPVSHFLRTRASLAFLMAHGLWSLCW